ncbi:hypothetical protein J421_0505 [Gemmatirosa kalamazoonensis]|uniref:Uncharacterized protein n=1 Tax=Gemmatirosa kalamazoonensis TaxID=861299 RepID=W0RC65_9BACT|nr:hypothetical protein [Gemmatirosa kalamazoonensis]AHG88042.1 hypothetical protein J421_0505 [Gemmatirosa kalamazoonensis]
MLVTVTPRLRIHRDEVLCAILRGNSVLLRFVGMKPMRVPVDDLTDEARHWLLPSLAPRDIPLDEGEEVEESVEEEVEEEEEPRKERRA